MTTETEIKQGEEASKPGEASAETSETKETSKASGESSETKPKGSETSWTPPKAGEETKESKETSKETGKETSKETETSEKSTTSEASTDESEKTKTERVVPSPTEYKLPEGMPKDVGEFANKNDMTQEQLDNTLSFFGSYEEAKDTYQKEQLREAGENHVEKWGDKKDTNLSLVRRTLKTTDKDGKLTKLLDDTGFGNHPVVLDYFLGIAQEFKEGGFLPSEVNRPAGKASAAQAMFGKNHPSKQN